MLFVLPIAGISCFDLSFNISRRKYYWRVPSFVNNSNEVWVAHYASTSASSDYTMAILTSTGRVNGIKGKVD